MKSATREWLNNLRLEAQFPGTLFVALRSRAGNVLLFPEEINSTTDEQLLSIVRRRLIQAANEKR